MIPETELRAIYQQKQEEEDLLRRGSLCQAFKGSEMYVLLASMMEAIERDALANLNSYTGADRDQVFAFTMRWQERRRFREAVLEQIDINIEDAAALIRNQGGDPEEWMDRSTIEHGT